MWWYFSTDTILLFGVYLIIGNNIPSLEMLPINCSDYSRVVDTYYLIYNESAEEDELSGIVTESTLGYYIGLDSSGTQYYYKALFSPTDKINKVQLISENNYIRIIVPLTNEYDKY